MWARKVAVIGLAAAYVAAAVATDENEILYGDESKKAIYNLCLNTTFPDTCIARLSEATNSSDTKTLIKVGFQLIIKETENSIKELPTTVDVDSAETSGLNDTTHCQIVLESSIKDLRKALDQVDSVESADVTVLARDLQTYLNESNAFNEFCLYLLKETRWARLFKVVYELTSDAIDWVNVLPRLMKSP